MTQRGTHLPTASTDHVLYALEKLGHTNLADAITRHPSANARGTRRELAEHGFTISPRLTVKTDEIRVALSIRQDPEDQLPLFNQ